MNDTEYNDKQDANFVMNQSLDPQIIQKQIGEMQKTLNRVMVHLARMSDAQTPVVIRDLTLLSSSLNSVKTTVTGQMQVHEKQIKALVGLGSVINSSLGLKRVLSEVMDSLVALMRAERGFLMLREPNGELIVQVARGLEKVDLNEAEFAISKTIVRQVVESGEVVLTTNAQDDPRFGQQFSVAAYHLLSILCAPLKLKNELIGVIYVDNRIHSGIFQQTDPTAWNRAPRGASR